MEITATSDESPGVDGTPRKRTALITGGTGGIGLACADLLERDGWTVVVGDLGPAGPPPPDQAGRRLRIDLDVRDDASVRDAVATTLRQGGGLDLLVNCAGVQVPALLTQMHDDEWYGVLDVNLHGTWRCLREAGRAMVAAGSGAVVNIASIAADRGVEGRSAYAASKAAVVSLTRSAAVEWAASGVRVNAVAPGFVDTELTRTAVRNGMVTVEALRGSAPMRRLGLAEEIAAAVVFLGSDAASFVTGQTLFVDGGFSADYRVGLAEQDGHHLLENLIPFGRYVASLHSRRASFHGADKLRGVDSKEKSWNSAS